MSISYEKESANFFGNFVSECSRSISEMQKLKADILKHDLFTDPDEREEVILLIDEIIWEETYAASAGREQRQKNLMEIANLTRSIQEREARSQPISGR